MIKVTYDDKEVVRKLDALKKAEFMRQYTTLYTDTLRDRTSLYPSTSEANRPGPSGRWYERGFGTRWLTGGRRTSQNLKSAWYTKVTDEGGEIGNEASYAAYVHDQDMQAWFHKERGWKTVQSEADLIISDIENQMVDTVDRTWDRS